MKKLKCILPMAAFVLAVVGVAGATGLVGAETNENAVIPSKVYIGEVAVGGMTEEEAKEAVIMGEVNDKLESQITLRAGENEMTVSAAELGVEWSNTNVVEDAVMIGKVGNLIQRYKDMKDLEHEDKVYDIEYGIDDETLTEWLDTYAAEMNQEPVEYKLKREDGDFIIVDGQEGIAVDVEESVASVVSYFEEEWEGTDGIVSLAANVVEPRVAKEDLESIQDVLGSFSTDFSDSAAGRVVNVKNATSKIDGTVLYPGEEFSVHDAIAPLTADNGYELAGSYENGTTVESYGGGVCQVSTTLYNAVIRAELEITERFAHSMIVSYVKPSMDAAIAGDYKDLRFKNSLDTPIYIEGYSSGGILYFNVFGKETRPANRKVTFESQTTSQTDPTPKFVASGDPIGSIVKTQSAHIGKTATLWKIVTVDGVETSREEFNTSKYNPSPSIYSVGTASANAEAVAEMNAAIATQDETLIRTAASLWNDAAVAARQPQEPVVTEPQGEAGEPEGEGNGKKNDSDKKNGSDKKNEEGEPGNQTEGDATGETGDGASGGENDGASDAQDTGSSDAQTGAE